MLALDMAMSSHGQNDDGSSAKRRRATNRKASFPSTRFLFDKIIISPGPRVKTTSPKPWETGSSNLGLQPRGVGIGIAIGCGRLSHQKADGTHRKHEAECKSAHAKIGHAREQKSAQPCRG